MLRFYTFEAPLGDDGELIAVTVDRALDQVHLAHEYPQDAVSLSETFNVMDGRMSDQIAEWLHTVALGDADAQTIADLLSELDTFEDFLERTLGWQ